MKMLHFCILIAKKIMNIQSKEFISGLSQLEMVNTDGNSFG